MIIGEVSEREARVQIVVSSRKRRTIQAVIDTGYNGWLTLPPSMIRSLDLPWKTATTGTLADGTEAMFEVYEGNIVWDGKTRRIQVHEADGSPLIGMAIMADYELRMQVRDGGKVTIKRLPG